MFLTKKFQNYELTLSEFELTLMIRLISEDEPNFTEAEEERLDKIGRTLWGSRNNLRRQN